MGRSPGFATLIFTLLPCALQAIPALSIPTVTPSTVVAGQATPVTATCQITTTTGDPALLPNGMNLVRLTAAGADSAVLGVMTAGVNNTYSYTFTDTELAAGQYQLQCAAAFAATIRRIGSPAATVTVTPNTSPPAITAFAPQSGTVGTMVTINGANFGAIPQVTMPGLTGIVSLPIQTMSAVSLTVLIPAGAVTGAITVTNNAGSAQSASPFTVNPPSSFTLSATPASAKLIQGQSVAYSVQLSSANGFNQLAQLGVTGLPSGVTASFKPSSITAGQTAVLTLTAPATQPLAATSISVSAAATVLGIPQTQSASAALAVVAPTTTLLGRTVVSDPLETPLAGVTIKTLGLDGNGNSTGCTGNSTVSDSAGNFQLTNLPTQCTGPQLIAFDGTTATSPAGKYAGVNLVFTLVAAQVTASPVLVHLPRIDNVETFMVQQNATTDQSYNFTTIPGLSVTVYAGTTFTEADGTQPNPFPLAAVQVPVDRLPDLKPNVPTMERVFIVAFQPANTVASQPVPVRFPTSAIRRPASTWS